MGFFEQVMTGAVFPALQSTLGDTVPVVYRSAELTKEITVLWCHSTQQIDTMSDPGAGIESKIEVVRVHIPTDPVNGIPNPDSRALIERDGKTWAIQSIEDISETSATILATRTLEFSRTARHRRG